MVKFAGTGHRPPHLGLTYSDEDQTFLKNVIISEIKKIPDLTHGISGLASGFDLAYALAMIDLNIPFIAALPFKGQADKWPKDAKRQYEKVLENAAGVFCMYERYIGNWQYYERDMWMVDYGDKVLCLYSGDKRKNSGTRLTVEYAQSLNKEIVNIWEAFAKAKAERN